MRLLVVDHGCCDPPLGRVFHCRALLAREGIESLACGPASVSALEAPTPGLHGIHLRDIAAGNRTFARAVRDGTAEAFLQAVTSIPEAMLGLVRETARQAIAEAVDAFDPAAILVLHAGIFADLAVETGVPVIVHVAADDLAALERNERINGLVAAALESAEVVVVADAATQASLIEGWFEAPSRTPAGVWAIDEQSGERLAAMCRLACSRRGS